MTQRNVQGDEGACAPHAAPAVHHNGRSDGFCVLAHLQNDIQKPDAREWNATWRPRAVEVMPHKAYLLADCDSNRAIDSFGLDRFLQRLQKHIFNLCRTALVRPVPGAFQSAHLDLSREHDNEANVMLPHHSPEVPHCGGERCLGRNVRKWHLEQPSPVHIVSVDVPPVPQRHHRCFSR